MWRNRVRGSRSPNPQHLHCIKRQINFCEKWRQKHILHRAVSAGYMLPRSRKVYTDVLSFSFTSKKSYVTEHCRYLMNVLSASYTVWLGCQKYVSYGHKVVSTTVSIFFQKTHITTLYTLLLLFYTIFAIVHVPPFSFY